MKKNDEQEMDKKSAKKKIGKYLGRLPVNIRPVAREKTIKSAQAQKK